MEGEDLADVRAEERRAAGRAMAKLALIGIDRTCREAAFVDPQVPDVKIRITRRDLVLQGDAFCAKTGNLLATATLTITDVDDFVVSKRRDSKSRAYPSYVNTLPGRLCRELLGTYFGAKYHREVRPCPWRAYMGAWPASALLHVQAGLGRRNPRLAVF